MKTSGLCCPQTRSGPSGGSRDWHPLLYGRGPFSSLVWGSGFSSPQPPRGAFSLAAPWSKGSLSSRGWDPVAFGWGWGHACRVALGTCLHPAGRVWKLEVKLSVARWEAHVLPPSTTAQDTLEEGLWTDCSPASPAALRGRGVRALGSGAASKGAEVQASARLSLLSPFCACGN